jgi:predicted negative regulator of RcsB-dependent stress response
MSDYMTEAEQLEAIKKWWLRHQNLITICLAVVVLIVLGARYWNWHVEKTVQQTSTTYDNMMAASLHHDPIQVQAYANELIEHHGKSVYAAVAHLTLAKVYLEKHDDAKAEKALETVAATAPVDALKQIASIRLSRLWVAQKQYDKALVKLDAMSASSPYVAIMNELKGDIYTAKGEYAKASTLYQSAMNESQSIGQVNQFLEMKNDAVKAMLNPNTISKTA